MNNYDDEVTIVTDVEQPFWDILRTHESKHRA